MASMDCRIDSAEGEDLGVGMVATRGRRDLGFVVLEVEEVLEDESSSLDDGCGEAVDKSALDCR